MPGLQIGLRQKGLTGCLLVQRVADADVGEERRSAGSVAQRLLLRGVLCPPQQSYCYRLMGGGGGEVEVTDDRKQPSPQIAAQFCLTSGIVVVLDSRIDLLIVFWTA